MDGQFRASDVHGGRETGGWRMDEPSGNVTAILGKGALLNCRVRGIGNRTVGVLECSEVKLYNVKKSCVVRCSAM